MKYLLSLICITVISVIFLFFLFNNPYFVPSNTKGTVEWLNLSVLLLIFSIIIFCIVSLIAFSVLKIIKKDLNRRKRIFLSSKIALFFTIGLLLVFILNFFHILDWIWGISVFLVVLIATFII